MARPEGFLTESRRPLQLAVRNEKGPADFGGASAAVGTKRPGERSGDVARAGRPLLTGNHGPRQILAVAERRQNHAGDMRRDQKQHQVREHLVQFLHGTFATFAPLAIFLALVAIIVGSNWWVERRYREAFR